MFYGVDFGTCYSMVAVAWKDEKGNVGGAKSLTDIGRGEPTLILYDREKKKTVFGDDCRRGYGLMHPEDVIRNLKGMVRKAGGLEFEVQSGGVAFSGEDLLSMYIGHLLDDARAKAMKYSIDGTTAIEGVTVTVPVAIHKDNISSTRYREVLKKVVSQKMGVTEDIVTVISEPIAAAVSYMASGNIEGGDRIRFVVFDMGGGTTDVALVDFDPIHLEGDVIKTGGDPGLGGNDWDEALKRLVLAKAGASQKGKKGVNPDDPAFNEDITNLKEGLSTREKEYIEVGGEIYTVTRREFEDATAGLLEKALGCMGDIVDKSVDRKIDAIILTGGSCNMPQVQRGISEKYPHLADRVMTISPSHAIAQGAARYALGFTSSNISQVARTRVPSECTYGFDTRDQYGNTMIYNLIHRGQHFDSSGRIEAKSDRPFSGSRDKQDVIDFIIYETQSNKEDMRNWPWMKVEDAGTARSRLKATVKIPSEYRGKATQLKIWPALVLDNSGILTVKILDENNHVLTSASTSVKDGNSMKK